MPKNALIFVKKIAKITECSGRRPQNPTFCFKLLLLTFSARASNA